MALGTPREIYTWPWTPQGGYTHRAQGSTQGRQFSQSSGRTAHSARRLGIVLQSFLENCRPMVAKLAYSWAHGAEGERKAPHRGDSSPKALGELFTLPAVWGQFSRFSGRTVAPWWLNWSIHGLMEHKGRPRLHTGATVLPKPSENCSPCPPSGDSSPTSLGELSFHGG